MLCSLSLGADGFIPLERFADDADFLSLVPQMDPLASPSPSTVVGGDVPDSIQYERKIKLDYSTTEKSFIYNGPWVL